MYDVFDRNDDTRGAGGIWPVLFIALCVGVIALVAIPKVAGDRARHERAGLLTAVGWVAAAETAYARIHGTPTDILDSLILPAPPAGARIVLRVADQRFAVRIVSSRLPGEVCGMRSGPVLRAGDSLVGLWPPTPQASEPYGPGTEEPTCRNDDGVVVTGRHAPEPLSGRR